jgi:hypothetical protein
MSTLNPAALRQARWDESEPDVLRGLLAYDTGLTRLVMQSDGEYEGSLQVAQLGYLTALQHLGALHLAPLTARDCRALQRLQSLTWLALPSCGMVRRGRFRTSRRAVASDVGMSFPMCSPYAALKIQVKPDRCRIPRMSPVGRSILCCSVISTSPCTGMCSRAPMSAHCTRRCRWQHWMLASAR